MFFNLARIDITHLLIQSFVHFVLPGLQDIWIYEGIWPFSLTTVMLSIFQFDYCNYMIIQRLTYKAIFSRLYVFKYFNYLIFSTKY